MKIIDLSPEYEKTYLCCLEEWSDEMKESGNHKHCWYQKVKEKGLRVKLAQNDDGNIVGMIQYMPSEESHIEGKNLYFVLCIWVHGYEKHGVGNLQKKGVGKALLQAAEEDSKQLGANGLVVWGVALPFFMRASWFKKHDYSVVDKEGMLRLLWKPFVTDAEKPVFIKQKKTPAMVEGKVNVTVFTNGWCSASNIVLERARRAVKEFDKKISYTEINTSDKAVISEWGLSDAVFIDGKRLSYGPPISFEKLRKKIMKRVKKLK